MAVPFKKISPPLHRKSLETLDIFDLIRAILNRNSYRPQLI